MSVIKRRDVFVRCLENLKHAIRKIVKSGKAKTKEMLEVILK